jgi:exopolyphosphatase / guanosine-5'-triphosphate,3'-diphosphate pyrophosphatase
VTTYEHALDVRGRFAELDPLGVIDIGSNSVRLVVYEGAVRAPAPLFNEKVLCGLGRSVATTGHLGHEAVERALAALRRFRAIADILQVKSLRAVATAAVREAEDGVDFIMRGEEACGTKIEVLSGEKEAELAAHGIMMGFLNADGFAADLGGGSLELIDIAHGSLAEATTMPLGGLRLIDTTGGRLEKAADVVDQHLAGVPWLPKGRGRTFYAVGGTWRSLARMHMEQTGYPLRVMHGYALPTAEAIAFCAALRKTKKLALLPGIEEVSRARREVLPYGALVLERLLEQIGPEQVVFSVFGIREGLLYSLLPPQERAKDPLLSFCEDYARLRSRSVEHAHELIAWTDALFAPPGPKETSEERRLRQAACLISDIGWRAHPDYRGEQSLNVLAHAALGGIDHQGRIFLALAVYFRHTGPGETEGDELSERLKAVAGKRAQKRARIIGAAIRTAHMISVGMPGVIRDTPLSYDGDRLVLTLPKARAALDGERLRRRFETLAQLVGRQPEIRVSP